MRASREGKGGEGGGRSVEERGARGRGGGGREREGEGRRQRERWRERERWAIVNIGSFGLE